MALTFSSFACGTSDAQKFDPKLCTIPTDRPATGCVKLNIRKKRTSAARSKAVNL